LCVLFFVLHATATTEIYTLSLHDALPIYDDPELAEGVPDESGPLDRRRGPVEDRGPDERGLEDQPHRRIDDGDLPDLIVVREDRSEEHTSELQSRRDLVCRLLLEKKNACASTPSSTMRACRSRLTSSNRARVPACSSTPYHQPLCPNIRDPYSTCTRDCLTSYSTS